MLLQIQEATSMLKDLAELGPVYKLLIVFILLILAYGIAVTRLYIKKVDECHANEKTTLEVLGATNEVLRNGIANTVTKEEAKHLIREINFLRETILLANKKQ